MIEAQPPSLRPLGIGELLDRAVTLCVRRVLPLSLIYLAYGIPLGVVNFFASRGLASMMQAFADQLKAQSTGAKSDPHAFATAMAAGQSDPLWSIALLVFAFLGAPLVSGALIHAVAASYLGREPTFEASYRAALSRWLNLIGVNVLYIFSGLALYIVIIVVALVIALAVVAIASAAKTIGIAVGVVIGLVAAVAGIGIFLVITIAYNLSQIACVLEGKNFAASFTTGLGRVVRGIGLQRTLLVGLVYFAVLTGIGFVSFAGQATLTGLLHSAIAGTIFTVLVGLFTAAFLAAFLTLFYFDLRMREDGLDLQLAAEATLDVPTAG